MPVLDINGLLLTDLKNRVELVGIEVEGGWSKWPKPIIGQYHRDGSVKGFDNVLSQDYVGEIASPAIEPCLIEKWLTAHYPTHINETCGLHMHMSFASALMYARLMHIDYHDTVLHHITQWATTQGFPETHPIWKRLRGECEHCQLKFWPDKQVRQTRKIYDKQMEGHRYTAVNYCHGLNGMGTLEIRVLPMLETPAQSVEVLKLVINVTNACLIKLSKKEQQQAAELVVKVGEPERAVTYIRKRKGF